MFTSIKSRLGQASLEYVAVAVFVMAGILIGGPYVVRSINSNFKVLDEGVIDSERETITEGPTNVNLPVCECSDLVEVGCGDGVTAVNGSVCMPNQKVWRRTCSPEGCEMQMIQMHVFDHIEECRNDPTNTCCYPATDGFCGNDPSASGTCRSSDGHLRDKLAVCGSPSPITRVVQCQSDPANCLFACQAKSPNATWCPLTQNTFLPSRNWPVAYRNPGGCSSSASYCEAQCNAGYVVVSGTCLRHCPNGTCEPAYGENTATCPNDCPAPPPACTWQYTCESADAEARSRWPANRILWYITPNGFCDKAATDCYVPISLWRSADWVCKPTAPLYCRGVQVWPINGFTACGMWRPSCDYI